MTRKRWLVAGIVALVVGLAGVGATASPWWGGYGPGAAPSAGTNGTYGPAYGPGYGAGYGPGYGYGPGMMGGYGPGMMRGYGPGMMWGYWGSGSGGATPSATAPASVTVKLDDLRFDPAQIQVKVGTTVAFVNTDEVPHDVVNASLQDPSAAPAFASPLIPPGGTWKYTFDQAGTFPILCNVAGHAQAGMVGTVTVAQ